MSYPVPNVSRAHFLRLSNESCKLLYQNKCSTRNDEMSEESYANLLIDYFRNILQRSESTKLVALHECFVIENTVFIIVDLECDGSQISKGNINLKSTFFTKGPCVEPLKTLHLYITRPFHIIECLDDTIRKNKNVSSVDDNLREVKCVYNMNRFNCRNTRNLTHELCTSLSQCIEEPITENNVGSNLTIPNQSNVSVASSTHQQSNNNVILNKDESSSSSQPPPPKIKNSCHKNFCLNESWIRKKHTNNNSKLIQVNLLGVFYEALLYNPTTVFVRGRSVIFPNHGPSSFESTVQDHVHKIIADLALSCGVDTSLSLSTQLSFFTSSTGDLTLGIAIPNVTELCIELDPIGEFSDIHIAPVTDTVPVIYQFDFISYLQPFIRKSSSRLFFKGNIFHSLGVQFKVKNTYPLSLNEIEIPDKNKIRWIKYSNTYNIKKKEPYPLKDFVSLNSISKEYTLECQDFLKRCQKKKNDTLCSRIGLSTRIFEIEPTALTWIDLLPPNLIEQIQLMPTRLQPFALMQAVSHLSPQELFRMLGWSNDELFQFTETDPNVEQEMRDTVCKDIVEHFSTNHHIKKKIEDNKIINTEIDSYFDTSVCIVCLQALNENDRVLELPCSHTFHIICVSQWIKRSFFCPVCKRDMRSFLK